MDRDVQGADTAEIDRLIATADRLASELPATMPEELLSDLAYQVLNGSVMLPIDRPHVVLPYLIGALRHQVHRRIRSLVRERRWAPCVQDATAVWPDDEWEHTERETAVRAAVSNLPPRRRAVIDLYCLKYLFAKEVGLALGIREHTVYQEYQRAARFLRDQLREFSAESIIQR